MDYTLRVRPHVKDVIHDMGMDAPAAEITISIRPRLHRPTRRELARSTARLSRT